MVDIRQFWQKKDIPIILSVLVLLVLGGWYGWHRHQNQKAAELAASIPAPGWTLYKDTVRGFHFVYPKAWGPVHITEVHQQTGKSYTLSFAFASEATTKSGYGDIFVMNMDSNDISTKSCDEKNKNQCYTSSAYTKNDIGKVLSGDKKGLARFDSSSFAIYSYTSYSSLEINRIINLPKPNVTAVRATFQRYSSVSGCSQYKLETNVKTGCIGQSLYKDIDRILKSLQPV